MFTFNNASQKLTSFADFKVGMSVTVTDVSARCDLLNNILNNVRAGHVVT